MGAYSVEVGGACLPQDSSVYPVFTSILNRYKCNVLKSTPIQEAFQSILNTCNEALPVVDRAEVPSSAIQDYFNERFDSLHWIFFWPETEPSGEVSHQEGHRGRPKEIRVHRALIDALERFIFMLDDASRSIVLSNSQLILFFDVVLTHEIMHDMTKHVFWDTATTSLLRGSNGGNRNEETGWLAEQRVWGGYVHLEHDTGSGGEVACWRRLLFEVKDSVKDSLYILSPEVAAQANRRFDDGLLPAVEELFIVNEAILVSSDPAASMSRSRTRDFANLPPASPERDSSSNRLEGLGLIENSIRQVTRSGTAAAGGDRRT